MPEQRSVDPILAALTEAGKRGMTCRELVAARAAASNMAAFHWLLDLAADGTVTRLPGERYAVTGSSDATV